MRDESPGDATTLPAPVEPIAAAWLGAMLLDPDVPEASQHPYLMLDHTATAALEPAVRVNPHDLHGTPTGSALALGSRDCAGGAPTPSGSSAGTARASCPKAPPVSRIRSCCETRSTVSWTTTPS